jgi:cell wall-associated NlpC family hydrolase
MVALDKYNPQGRAAAAGGADCGVFVSTVMRASGADGSYPVSGTSAQEKYVRTSGKYQILEKFTTTSELQPGDILIVNQGGGEGGKGHTYIYIGGNHGPNGYNAASASLDSRMPNLGKAIPSDSRGNYLVARLK